MFQKHISCNEWPLVFWWKIGSLHDIIWYLSIYLSIYLCQHVLHIQAKSQLTFANDVLHLPPLLRSVLAFLLSFSICSNQILILIRIRKLPVIFISPFILKMDLRTLATRVNYPWPNLHSIRLCLDRFDCFQSLSPPQPSLEIPTFFIP